MMVNCPRCGFSQPQDQYCARCGIDMLAFKPAQKPLVQRIVSNTVFQITVLVVIVVTVFTVARQHRRRELAERVAEIENARNTQILGSRSNSSRSESSSSPESHSGTNAAAQPSQQMANAPLAPSTAPARPPASDGAGQTQSAGFVQPNANDDKGQAAAGNRTARAASNLYVTFAQLPRAAVSELVNSAEPGSGILQGPFLAGVVQGLNARIKTLQSNSQIETLDSSSHSIKAAQTAEFYGGQRDDSSGQFLGFVVEVIPTQLDENESHLQLRIWRSLREASGQLDEVSIPLPDSFTVPHGAGIFVTGAQLLPRRTALNEQERRYYDPMKVLHVLTTEEFRQGLADLVIFIEPK